MRTPDALGRYEVLMALDPKRQLARVRGVSGFERHVVIEAVQADDPDAPRFIDSARALARMHHQHVASVLELGREGDRLFLVREYVHGRSLSDVWRRAVECQATLPHDFAVTVCAAAAAALQHVGEPREGSMDHLVIGFEGAVQLTALGLGRAPEHLRGEASDARTDVFALGTLLYELTTMRPAFYDASERIASERLRAAAYQPPAELVAGYPPSLAQVVGRALRATPTERYTNPAELRRDLAAVARRLRLVVGDVAITEVMSQLYPDAPTPWLRPLTEDDEPTSIASQPPSPGERRLYLRSMTEAVDALADQNDTDEGDDNAAATMTTLPTHRDSETDPDKLGRVRRPSDFDSGAVTSIAADQFDPVTPTPVPTGPDLAAGESAPEMTQITAVPPPPPSAAATAGAPPADPAHLARLAQTIPPTDKAALLGAEVAAVLAATEPSPAIAEPPAPAPSSGQAAPSIEPLPIAPLPLPPPPPPARSRPPTPGPSAPRAVAVPVKRPTQPSRGRTALVLAIAVGAVLGVAVVVLVLVLGREEAPEAPAIGVSEAVPDARTAPAGDARAAKTTDAGATDARVVVVGPDAMPTTIRLQITTTPPGATILLDGHRLGKTPYDEAVDAATGEHTLKVRKGGFNTIQMKIELSADVRRAIDLVPARSDSPDDPDAGVESSDGSVF